MRADPVFVFGALRSGTTLLRLMLNGHPEITSPGEADFLFDHIYRDASGSWSYDRSALTSDRIFRDKEIAIPENVDGPDLAHEMVALMAARNPERTITLSIHRHAQKMTTLFPEAKIVHLLRDPRDVARSSIGMGWAGNAYVGADHWIDTESGWDAAEIDDVRVFDLTFEELMANPEAELVRLCDFLETSFDPNMLRYHETSTYGPPDAQIAQQWRTKARWGEVRLIEGRIGSLMVEKGYAPANGALPKAPGPLGHHILMIDHRLRRWRFNIRRYGLLLFLGHHLAGALRIRPLADRLGKRRQEILLTTRK